MLNNNNNKINEIMKQLITETIIVDDETDEVKTVVKFSKILNGLIKNNKTKFVLDYDEEIIKSEAVASFYEELINAAKILELNENEIRLENNELMKLAYSRACFKMKERLFSSSKRNEHKNDYVTLMHVTDDGIDLFNEKLNELALDDYLDNKKESELLQLIRLDSKMLTKKQREYIEKGRIINSDSERESDRKLRRRIEKRVNDKMKEKTVKEMLTIEHNEIIDKILDAKDFRKEYDKYKDEDFISEAIVDNVDAEFRKKFNKGSNDSEVIKKMKIGLRRAKNFKIYK